MGLERVPAMSWGTGDDVQRELTEAQARRLVSAFDWVRRDQAVERIAIGMALADLISSYVVSWRDPESEELTAELRAFRLQELMAHAGQQTAAKAEEVERLAA